MEAIEGHAFHQSNSCDEFIFSIVDISPIAHGERMIDGKMEAMYECANYTDQPGMTQVLFDSPSSGSRLPVYSMKRYGKAP